MQSAFGVDHGEVSKARFQPPFVKPRQGMPGGPAPSRAQKKTKGAKGAKSGPQKVAAGLHKIGSADISLKGVGAATGRSMRGVGGFFEKRPGLTGTALVGGGGAAGYHFLKPERKKAD